jgi:pilus assembly protein CpaF
LADVDMSALLKRALRLRPDRIIVGEVRGAEAMSLLMALASGHGGSFSSLHAASPKDAMLRLEMLIQMGAPSWNLNSVRKLLASTLKYIFVLKKNESHRQLAAIYEISSLEENGFTFFRLDE